MKISISKFRSRSRRSRRKAASKAVPPSPRARHDHPVFGILLGLAAWGGSYLLVLLGQQVVSGSETPPMLAGAGILLAAGLGICVVLLWILNPSLLQSNAKILLMVLIFFLTAGLIRTVLYLVESGWLHYTAADFLLPLSLAPLLATFLLGAPGGLAVGLWSAFSAAVMTGQSFRVLTTGMLVTVTAAALSRHIRRRSSVFRIGLMLGLTQMVCVAGFSLLRRDAPNLAAIHLGASLANGIICAILALVLLPLFEMLFDITTDVSLIELSDLGHPLLQRLAIEAPGTYHHSLVVATLAQTAAEAIGANGLLARVSSYFHDIGKLTKPEYFTENIQTRQDPHENLTPTMSALLIVAHVKEGIGMAISHRLPRLVIDAIERHHGTGLVSFFHHKALQRSEREQQAANGARGVASTVSEENFRYPGPLPVTRETSIIALADAVEAASRSLIKPTPGHIEEMINEITRRKWIDRQLDDSCLTLAEVKMVKRAFAFSLINMLHSRIPYPKTGEHSAQQSPTPPARTNGET